MPPKEPTPYRKRQLWLESLSASEWPDIKLTDGKGINRSIAWAVLRKYGDHVNDETKKVFVSEQRVADAIGVNRSTVSRAIEYLQIIGLIRWEGERTERGGTRVFLVNLFGRHISDPDTLKRNQIAARSCRTVQQVNRIEDAGQSSKFVAPISGEVAG